MHFKHMYILFSLQPDGIGFIEKYFPFSKYFANAPQPLFKGVSFEEDWDIAEVCICVI